MKIPLLALAAMAAVGALGLATLTRADGPATRFGTWGFDLAGRDTAVRPGVNFYDYANGKWVPGHCLGQPAQ